MDMWSFWLQNEKYRLENLFITIPSIHNTGGFALYIFDKNSRIPAVKMEKLLYKCCSKQKNAVAKQRKTRWNPLSTEKILWITARYEVIPNCGILGRG